MRSSTRIRVQCAALLFSATVQARRRCRRAVPGWDSLMSPLFYVTVRTRCGKVPCGILRQQPMLLPTPQDMT